MSTLSVLADIGGRGAIVGFLLPVTIVALVAYGVFELLRSRAVAPDGAAATNGPTGAPVAPASSSALAILDERFARGEVDAEEYVQRRNLLAPPPPAVWHATAAPDAPAAPGAPEVADSSQVDSDTTEQPAAEQRDDTTG